MVAASTHGVVNIYPQLDNAMQFRFDKINEILLKL